MTPPIRQRNLPGWENGITFRLHVHFPVAFGEIIPFNVPIKNQNRVGGVMTPPYESIPQNYNFSMLHLTSAA